MKLYELLQSMLQDRRGIAAVEYAVLLGVVGAAVFVAFNNFDISGEMATLIGAGTDAISAASTAATD